MKKFLIIFAVLFCSLLWAGSPCYYLIEVTGDLSCEDDTEGCSSPVECTYGSPETGCGIYTFDSDTGTFGALDSNLIAWGFGASYQSAYARFESQDEGNCLLIGYGSVEVDPNFFNCESNIGGSVSIPLDTFISEERNPCYEYVICTGDLSVNITRLCGCDDLLAAVASCGSEAFDPNSVECNCDSDMQDKAKAQIEDQTKEHKDQNPNLTENPATGADPIVLKSGALTSSIADIHIPGKMMDINFIRTYSGDTIEPGFEHKFTTPWQGQITRLSPGIFLCEGGVAEEGSSLVGGECGYLFMTIGQVDYTFDDDIFDLQISDPTNPYSDPNNYGKVSFCDYDNGAFTVDISYHVYVASDPNGINGYIVGLANEDYSKTFNYTLSPRTGRLGRKWNHNYDIKLELVEDDNEEEDSYLLHTGKGKQMLFTGNYNDFRCATDTDKRLYFTGDVAKIAHKGGVFWTFDNQLRLSKITDKNGNTITLSYQSPSGISGDSLYRVTNDAGRYIQFTYDQTNLIDYITDSFGRVWDYNRIGSNLTEVVKPLNDENNNPIKDTYTYSGGLLASMTDGASQTWQQNQYSGSRIIKQFYGDGYFDIDYYLDNDDYVYITDRNGNGQKVYLTDTGLTRKTVVELADSTESVTEYTYDFDLTGEPEDESKTLLMKKEMPAGDIFEYTYDNYGNITSITHKSDESDAGLKTIYDYTGNFSSYPSSIKDPAGNTVNFSYQDNNIYKIILPEVEVTDPNDYSNIYTTRPEYTLSYNEIGQITNIKLPDGINIGYYYDYNGYPVEIIYDNSPVGLNITLTLTYDTRGNVSAVTDPDGVVTSYLYDNIDNLTSIVNGLNEKTKINYNGAGLVSSVYRQLGPQFNENTSIATHFEYNSVDKLRKITDSLGRITEFTLDGNDNIAQSQDPQAKSDGFSTQYTYNAFDLLESITLPESYDPSNPNTTTITHTVDGLTESATDANGGVTNYYYDGYRRLRAIEYPDQTTQRYSYDARGFITSEEKRDGSVINYRFDAMGRLTDKAIDSASGTQIGMNNLGADYFATGSWTATDDQDCISGRYVSTTDPNAAYLLWGSETGRFAISIRYPSFGTTDSNSSVKVIVHCKNGEKEYLVDQRFGGDSWVYLGTLNFDQMPAVEISANGSDKITAVDAVKFVPVKSFQYDVMGRLTKAPGYEFTYDRAGRLSCQKDSFGRETRYEYTASGKKSKLIWDDGYFVSYGYDAAGRLNSITDSRGKNLWGCSYDKAGRRIKTTGVYGLVSEYDYEGVNNNDHRGIYLDNIKHTLGSNILEYDYTRDLAGNIVNQESGGVDISYLYDKNYSLKTVSQDGGSTINYDYDNLFNRTSVETDQSVVQYSTYSNGLNQYSQIDNFTFDYDDNGNLTRKDTHNFTFDSENRLTAHYNLIGEPNDLVVNLYSYDAFGRRISKSSASGLGAKSGSITESYLYDGFQVIGEYGTDAQHIKRRFIYADGIDEPVAMIVEPDHQGYYGLDEFSAIAASWLYDANDIGYLAEADYNNDDIINFTDSLIFISDYYLNDRPLIGSSKYYGYAFDGLGSVVALTYRNDPNETGNSNELPYFVETYTYDPFGTPSIYDAQSQAIAQSAVGNPYMFTARRYDSETGLYYYRFRMYDSELGRFLQTDPIGFFDSMNLYQYCANNPINFVDPLGKWYTPPTGPGSRTQPIRLERSDLEQAYYKTRTSPLFPTGMFGKWEVLRMIMSDTHFYRRSGYYYLYNGKKYTGEEINYIGMGGAAEFNGFSDTVVNFWNPEKMNNNGRFFLDLGRQLEVEFQKKYPNHIQPPTVSRRLL